jgi:ABC-2 type transport system ATP-binding protein
VRLQFEDPNRLESAVRRLREGARDDAALTLQLASDGSVGSLRALLDRLDRESIEPDGMSVHTPDLDDVFLTLTGNSDNRRDDPR